MLVAVVSVFVAAGCVGRDERVDPGLARAARHELLAHQRVSELEEFYEEPRAYEEPGSWTDVVIAQTLAIFPGIILHGAGHWYAGDRRTAKQLSRIGQFGYLLTAIGGGVVYGGYEADQAGLDGLATSLYASGGLVGGAGILYIGTAWVYDLIDTPRAVRERGAPPPRSTFVDSLDVFGD